MLTIKDKTKPITLKPKTMKKLFYIFMVLISANSFNAQITLAGQLNYSSVIWGLQMVHFSSGYNFVQQVDSTTPSMTNYSFIRIYDLNLNPIKTILLPIFSWPGYIQVTGRYNSFISDHLFNLDNSIEFIVKYQGTSNQLNPCSAFQQPQDSSVAYVMNENGVVLATFTNGTSCYGNPIFASSYYSDGSTFSKLVISTGYSTSVYNLPGFLPCETCSMPTGFSSQGANSADGMKVNVQPNPSSGDFTFQYSLPKDKQNGELAITDIGGSQVKTVHVTNQSGSVSVNMSDLSSGVYIFQLKSGTSQSSPQKIILAK